VLALVALVFTKYYFLFTSEYYPPAYADKVAKFEADKVFQKRFLVPVTANFISHNTTLSFDRSLKFIIVLCTFGLLYYFQKVVLLTLTCHLSKWGSHLLRHLIFG